MKNWDATQYSRYEEERNRPIQDLLSRISLEDVKTAMDLGCGPGNSTELLARRFPLAAVSGLDNSSEMLDAARKRLPHIPFTLSSIPDWCKTSGETSDVLLANAVFQWVPDHAQLMPALIRRLTVGGVLAVQMPDNQQEPSHRLMRELASREPWTKRVVGAQRDLDLPHRAEWYFDVLSKAGASVDVWRTTYHHPLPGGMRAVVEWFKGSALRPILRNLDSDEQQRFLTAYEQELAGSYPILQDGSVLLPFPRLFFVARRNA